jgi:hypothetical protein
MSPDPGSLAPPIYIHIHMCIHTYIDIVHLHRLGIIMIHCGNPHQLGHGISQVGIGSLCPAKIHKNN